MVKRKFDKNQSKLGIKTLDWNVPKENTQNHAKTQKNSVKIKRIYNNYNACKNCNARTKCCASSQTHKTITEYESEIQKAMTHKIEKQEYKDKYAKKSSIEGPFGIFKEQFQLEKELIIGMIKTEERIKFRCASIQFNPIIQHKINNRKYNRRFRIFL